MDRMVGIGSGPDLTFAAMLPSELLRISQSHCMLWLPRPYITCHLLISALTNIWCIPYTHQDRCSRTHTLLLSGWQPVSEIVLSSSQLIWMFWKRHVMSLVKSGCCGNLWVMREKEEGSLSLYLQAGGLKTQFYCSTYYSTFAQTTCFE